MLVAIIAATLIMGTSVIPMQSYADRDNNDDHKKDKDFKSKIIASSESDKKSASQHRTRTTSATGATTVSRQTRDSR